MKDAQDVINESMVELLHYGFLDIISEIYVLVYPQNIYEFQQV